MGEGGKATTRKIISATAAPMPSMFYGLRLWPPFSFLDISIGNKKQCLLIIGSSEKGDDTLRSFYVPKEIFLEGSQSNESTSGEQMNKEYLACAFVATKKKKKKKKKCNLVRL